MKITLRTIYDYERATGHKLLEEGASLGFAQLLRLAYFAQRPGITFEEWSDKTQPEEFAAMLPVLNQEIEDFFRRLQPPQQARVENLN